MTSQISLFGGEEPLKINKKIRLIELFAGIGAQAKALENIGADFEHYRICEFDKYAVNSYNAIHGTDFPVSDITKWHAEDMGIEEKDKYEYVVTYSFPCQSLSISGKQEGMAKGSSTRSGLLWEVERILEECNGNLPQVLLMENVDAILFEKNRKHFFQWCNRLEEFGYKNYYEVLNARDYGIPQNRNRCFMVSVLGDYYYEFPKPIKLELCVKDLLESEVAEKYYISAERVKELFNREYDGKNSVPPNGNETLINHNLSLKEAMRGWKEICPTLTASDYNHPKVAYIPNINPEHEVINMGKTICEERTDEGLRFFKDGCIGAIRTIDGGGDKRVIEPQLNQVAQMYDNESNPQAGRVYDIDGISPAMDSCQGGNRMPKFAIKGELNCYNQYKPDGIQTSLNDRVYDSEGVGLAITTSPYFMPSYLVKGEPELTEDGIKIRTNNSKGYDIAQDGDTINLERPNSKTRRGIVGKQIAQTLNTSTQQAVVIKDEVNVVGNYMKSGYDASRIIDPDGIAPAVKENHGTVTAVCEMNPKEDNGFFQQAIKTFKENNCKEGDTINAFNNTVDSSGISPTITTRPEGKKTAILCVVKEDTIRQATKKGYIECEVGGVADFSYPKSELRRGRVQEGGNVSPAITASGTEIMKIENSEVYYRIRKLTPRECFRLMGFKDIDFTKAKYKFDKESDLIYEIMNEDILESDKVKKIEEMGIKVSERTSNSQCYKQAGNSIVVDVLEAIFRNMNIKGVKRWQE